MNVPFQLSQLLIIIITIICIKDSHVEYLLRRFEILSLKRVTALEIDNNISHDLLRTQGDKVSLDFRPN